jgi:hypothetical protein
MSGPAKETTTTTHSKEMNNGSIPKQMDNKNFGKKRQATSHKFSVKSTKDGKTYWIPSIKEDNTFVDFLLKEDQDSKALEKLTVLPQAVIGELKKLINKGAKDLEQNWSDAAELVNVAYHVAQIRRPIPSQKGAWAQYTDLLRHGVHQLWKERGNSGGWRVGASKMDEGYVPTISPLYEDITSGSRFFVKIPGAIDVEIDGKDLSGVIKELSNKIRRQGGSVEVRYRTQEGAVLVVHRNGEEVEEIIIQAVS